MKPLQSDILEKKKYFEAQLAPINQDIIDRLDYILKKIGEVLGGAKIKNWWIDGAEEGELGDINKIIYKDRIECSCIYFDVSLNDANKDYGIIINGKEWGLDESFPIRWLFENFEEELIEGRKKYISKQSEKEKLQAKKKELSKQTNDYLINSAKSKLSKEERKALGLK